MRANPFREPSEGVGPHGSSGNVFATIKIIQSKLYVHEFCCSCVVRVGGGGGGGWGGAVRSVFTSYRSPPPQWYKVYGIYFVHTAHHAHLHL
jgi:hypothetical protein